MFQMQSRVGLNVKCLDLRLSLGMMTGSSSSSRREKEDKVDAIKAESRDKEKSVDCGATTARGEFSLVAPFRK